MDTRSSPENRTCCWLHHFLTMDSEMLYSWAISQFLLNASASAMIFNMKLRSCEWWRVLGIFATEQEVEVYLWLFMMRMYQLVLQLSFKSVSQCLIEWNQVIEYLLFNLEIEACFLSRKTEINKYVFNVSHYMWEIFLVFM